jgi:hypothetical protein
MSKIFATPRRTYVCSVEERQALRTMMLSKKTKLALAYGRTLNMAAISVGSDPHIHHMSRATLAER